MNCWNVSIFKIRWMSINIERQTETVLFFRWWFKMTSVFAVGDKGHTLSAWNPWTIPSGLGSTQHLIITVEKGKCLSKNLEYIEKHILYSPNLKSELYHKTQVFRVCVGMCLCFFLSLFSRFSKLIMLVCLWKCLRFYIRFLKAGPCTHLFSVCACVYVYMRNK